MERTQSGLIGAHMYAWVLAGASLFLLGCSSSPVQPASQAGGACALGQTQTCLCPDTSTSTLTCGATGVFGACACAAQGGAGATAAGSGGTLADTSTAGLGAAGAAGAAGADGGAAGAAGTSGLDGGAAGSGGQTACGWPTADPNLKGPYATVTESNVGPGGAFTMYRPMDLTQPGLPHPLITWGNGTGTTPPTYAFLLNQLASHGFIVIASNSSNVAQGTPAPMIQGVDWVLQQNDDATSALYQHVDATHIGATGHSQGAIATSSADTDARLSTMAPIEGGRSVAGQHGPALLLCGGKDTTLPCSGHMASFTAIGDRPVMLANLLAEDHMGWISSSFTSATLHPFVVAVTAWMRVHLMCDDALRPYFYGADCTLCKDAAWQVMRKMM